MKGEGERGARSGGGELPSPGCLQLRVEGPRDALLLLPGAAHATKRWPAERFAAVGRRWDGPVLVLGGPGEEALCQEVARRCGAGTELVCERGFAQSFRILGRAALALGGDSGLSHLCAAAGIPTAVIFGPTASRDGFWGDRCLALEEELPCRPCSRYGRQRCPIGDHLCMTQLSTERVAQALEKLRP